MKLSLSERQRAPPLPSPPSPLLHAPLGLLAALQNSARGHSGNHLFPAEHRARGMQEARLTNLRGKVVVCQCACCEISPSPPFSAICRAVRLTGEMKCCRTERNTNVISHAHGESVRLVHVVQVYHWWRDWETGCGTVCYRVTCSHHHNPLLMAVRAGPTTGVQASVCVRELVSR